ncbi:leucine-rich repeat receptor-like tyrosine-protein kinase PXC3 isoform X2 [Andrographis paniculata]|uniref:leucine-rich repeat receptor-like tyrosine-protein kinase PXC3 isoform X2 n=1 Tax=Andrographis paniculata TaxID=175694 RepID=UPI0021E965F5|nr:leucine-rich repeat receptor-like tyrosine-protein kinase PXC3 isoform X2 [Andrographis paniculata]
MYLWSFHSFPKSQELFGCLIFMGKKKMLFLSLLNIILFGLLSTSQSQLLNDELTLFAIGQELKITGWSMNTSHYCTWPGISCSPNFSAVQKLDLSNQRLQGNVTVISHLKSLKWLDLSSNSFHGIIPPAFGNLSELEFLDLSFNHFEGSIPLELSRLRNLRALNLSNNELVGLIPDELQSLHSLQDLQIYTNRLNGSIPSWIANLTNLRVFTSYENELSGEIPNTLGSISELQLLNLHSNRLEGSIPDSIFHMEKLETLVLTQNQFSGYIPGSIGNCKGLSSIRIGNNNLIGGIPEEIGNIISLTYFEANNNNLSGEITPEFSKCSNLTLLNLASNGFNGTIPSEFGLLGNLQELIVSGNALSGDIPTSVFRGKNLNKLDLSSNRFNGSIPESICSNSSRLQYLLLSRNTIRGQIPSAIGNCLKLLELQLGSNLLSGSIPAEIGRIKNLQIALNLSFNRLHGQLPEDLGRLDKLVTLDVSYNQISGSIPAALRGMLSLIEVNFSNNRLTGAIPSFAPFQKSLNSSFLGNKGLCGEPLIVSCQSKNGNGYYHHRVSYRLVLAVIGSGLAVFASVTVVVCLFMMRERQEKAAKDAAEAGEGEDGIGDSLVILAGNVFVENLRQAVDFEAVAKATVKESNKISVGTFSAVYKAEMPSGMSLSVRKLKSMDRTIINHQGKMIREVEKLSKLSHDNLMRPIGFVLFEDVVLLLHKHFENGTLAEYLRDSTKKPDWLSRLAIAIGVAEGLAFLHHVAILHLDISSGNVVLDTDLNPLVGEVEISKLLDPSRGTASISAVAGSFGYIPPEYAYTMQVTAPGNVYSYGVVLLEILTSRQPVEDGFGEGIDLVKWVHGAPARGETPEQILDARLSTVSFGWRKEMLAALKVALQCTDTTPAKRPKMKKVVEMLREIGSE